MLAAGRRKDMEFKSIRKTSLLQKRDENCCLYHHWLQNSRLSDLIVFSKSLECHAHQCKSSFMKWTGRMDRCGDKSLCLFSAHCSLCCCPICIPIYRGLFLSLCEHSSCFFSTVLIFCLLCPTPSGSSPTYLSAGFCKHGWKRHILCTYSPTMLALIKSGAGF